MSFWSVAQTESQRERTAQRFLEQNGFETYLPMIKVSRRNVPLFPAYLFVRIVDRWYSIQHTIGVLQLLSSGELPSRLDDKVIAQIRGQERNGVVRLPKPRGLQLGDRVVVLRGAFFDRVGLYDGQSSRDRQFVLLELLGRSVRVEVGKQDLRAIK